MRTKYPMRMLWRAKYGTVKQVIVYVRDGKISESGWGFWDTLGGRGVHYFETEAEAIACLYDWQHKRLAAARKEIKSAELALKKLAVKYPRST